MKLVKIFVLVFALAFSSLVRAETAAQWNYRFSILNPGVPLNTKWDAVQQQKYLKGLLAGPVGKLYNDPDNYQPPLTSPGPASPAVPSDPVVSKEVQIKALSRTISAASAALEKLVQ